MSPHLFRWATCLAAFALPLFAADFRTTSIELLPAPDVPESVRELIQAEGFRVEDSQGKVLAEYWMRTAPFDGPAAAGLGVRAETIPEGALIGVVRFPEDASDFLEQSIAPGFYTMRFGLLPEDGNHMGVAPNRDFAVLIPLAYDGEPARNYSYEQLVEMAKTAGNSHPTIVHLELPEGDETPHMWQNDMGHGVMDVEIAGEVMGLVVYGAFEE